MYRWGVCWSVNHVRSGVQVGSVLECESCEVRCTGGECVGV